MINKADKDPISDLALKTRKFVALRDEIIREIGHYCAELSHELFIEYTTDLVPQLLELEWTDELYQDYNFEMTESEFDLCDNETMILRPILDDIIVDNVYNTD